MRLKLVTFLTVALVASAAAADEPWKNKPYKQWDNKDLRMILTDSPWVKAVTGDLVDRAKRLTVDAPAGAPTEVGKKEEGDDEDEKDEKDEKDEQPEHKAEKVKSKITFLVRWVSSRTLREASVRGQIIQGRASDADADSYIQQTPDDYQIVVVSQDMTSFAQDDEASLARNSQLRTKTAKRRVASNRVEIVRAADGRKINAIVFHFPRKLPSGEDVIMPNEKAAQFGCSTDRVRIKAEFQVQQMADQQGIDL